MLKLKGLKKAVGEYNWCKNAPYWRADLMLDTSTGELWTDRFYGYNYSWNEYHDKDIINLSLLMRTEGECIISMKTIKAFCEKHFKEINAREQEEPTPEDLIALSKSALESAEDAITLEEYKTQKEYSGRLMIRIPKELHRDLIEAAKKNGVSLNQYAMYKLAK